MRFDTMVEDDMYQYAVDSASKLNNLITVIQVSAVCVRICVYVCDSVCVLCVCVVCF